MKSYIKDDKAQILLLLSLVTILFINAFFFNIAGYSYGRFFAILIVAIAACLSIENAYYLVVFSFPFASILKLSATTISILPILYAIIILKLVLSRNFKINNTECIAALIIAAMQLLYVALYGAGMMSIISIILNIVFVMFSVSYLKSRGSDSNKLITTSAIFLLVAVALNILICDIFPDIPYIIDVGKQSALQADNRFGGLFIEPNELAQVILVAVGFFVAVFKSIKSKALRIILVGIALYLAINGIRTNSKSYVLVILGLIVLSFFMYLVYTSKKKGFGTVIVRFIPVFAVLALVSVYLVINIIIPVFEDRGSTGADILSNRGEIWSNYLSLLAQRTDVLLAGYGIGNVSKSLNLIGIETNVVPHNLYIEFVIQFGLIGLAIFAIAWKTAWREFFKKARSLFIIPILAFATTSLALSANSNDCFYILMLLIAMPYSHTLNNRSDTCEEIQKC